MQVTETLVLNLNVSHLEQRFVLCAVLSLLKKSGETNLFNGGGRFEN